MRRLFVIALVVLALSGALAAQEPSTSGTAGSLDANVALLTPQVGSATFTLTGTWSATANFERTGDGGTTWTPIACITESTGALVMTTTANGTFVCAAGGAQRIRARLNPYASGTATIAIYAGFGTAAVELARPLPAGTNVIGHVVADSGSTTAVTGSVTVAGTVTANAGTNLNTSALALETGGNLAAIKTDADKIPSQGQALAAASMPVVLPATQITTLTPPTTVTVTQGTASNLKVDLSGTAANATAIKVDGSAVTQPISDAKLPATQALSDTLANPTVTGIGSYMLGWDSGAGQWRRAAINAGLLKVDASGATIPVSFSAFNTATTGQQFLQVSATSNANGSALNAAGASAALVLVQCTPGCSGGTTINFEASQDSSTFFPVFAEQLGTNTIATSVVPSGTTATLWRVPMGATQYIRARISNYSAGTVAVVASATTSVSTPLVTNTNVVNTPSVAQSGTWNLNNISGTISLPTLAATSTKQSDGSQKTQIVDGSGNVIASTSNNLNVQCANCSGSGASAVDNASVTESTSVFAPIGAEFQTTPGTVTTGHQAMLAMTSKRGLQVSLFDASGTALLGSKVSASSVPVVVASDQGALTVAQPTGTNLHIVCDSGCSSSAAFADNGAFTFGTTAVNPIAGVLDDTSTNTATENSAAIARITPQKALHINLRNQAGTEIGTSSTPVQVTLANTGANGTAVKVDGSAVTQPVSGTVTTSPPANASTNIAQVNGVTTLTGTGATGTGAQRVTVAIDSATVAGSASLPAGTNVIGHVIHDSGSTTAVTGNVTTVQATASNLNAQVQGAAASGASKAGNPVQSGAVFNTTQPTVTTGQVVENQATARGALIVAPGVDGFAVSGTVTTSPPSNASTNVAQLAGTTTSVNSGVKDAGTLRVVLATDQPQLTNKLLVTPDSVALPANQSVNESQINGVTPLMGNGVTGTGSQRVTIASDNTAFSVNAIQSGTWTVQPGNTANTTAWLVGSADGGLITLGSKADAKSTATDTTSVSAMQVLKQISASVQAPPSQSVTNAGTFAVQATASPTTASGDAVSACNILSAASTNATSCKGSAGNLFGYELFNTSTTVYYLRLYNTAAAPTCSSATGFIRAIPIPPASAAGGVGGAVSNQVFGVQFGTGIGYCITGGSSSTDNTNAATGVFGEIRYK